MSEDGSCVNQRLKSSLDPEPLQCVTFIKSNQTMPSRRYLRNRNRCWNSEKRLSSIMEYNYQDDGSAHPPSAQQPVLKDDDSSDYTHSAASVGSPKDWLRAPHSSDQEGASQLYYAIFKFIGFPG